MKKLLALFLLAGCEDPVLTRVPDCEYPQCVPEECGQPCAVDAYGQTVMGGMAEAVTCHLGELVCTADQAPECVGFALPTEEVCDAFGVDEDCSGEANDLVYEWWDSRNTCDLKGECAFIPMVCDTLGNLECVPDNSTCHEEVCDGLDNDGDGLTDADDPDLIYSGVAYEYSGPPETLNVGECRAGVRRCMDGQETLFGEVLPVPEVCGNADDDDCDGQEDEVEGGGLPQAFEIHMDFSGSMSGTIFAVKEALCMWSANGSFTTSRFAIRGIATSTQAPYLSIITDFVTAAEACQALDTYLMENFLSGGEEYVPYSIFDANNNSVDGLVWPENMQRRVIFFTDEPPQGYQADWQDDMDDVVQDCNHRNYSVGGFIGNSYSQWRQMTDYCNGWVEFLSGPESMVEALNNRFGTDC